MDPHDEYEIGIEMQLHCALDAAGAARIVAHLQGCERCRNFLEAARKTDAAMNVMGAAAVSQVDWAKHEQRLRRMSCDWMVAMAVMAIGWVLYAAVFLHVYPGFSKLPFGIGVGLLLALGIWGAVRRARAAKSDPSVTLEMRRKSLTQMTSKASTFAVIAVALAVPLLFWSDRRNALGAFVFIQTALLLARHFFIQRPAARRELAELSE